MISQGERLKRMVSSKTDEKYWAQYDGLQNAKHSILRKYLDGWFPILSTWSGKVLYIDCHAGRGRHKRGQEGSPILAVRRLLDHTYKDRILNFTEVHFVFFEINPKNYEVLIKEIKALGNLPSHIHVKPYCRDYEVTLQATFEDLKNRNQIPAPTFAFVDPYGFNLSMNLLNTLLSFPKCELFINFMYRYVDMAISQEEQATNMDNLFGSSEWKNLRVIRNPINRSEAIIRLFSSQLKARYVTHMHMHGSNKALKYVLLHATNNKKGRELMKEAMWSVEPSGSFTAYERNSPNQYILLEPEPNLEPLKARLWSNFAGQKIYLSEIYDWLLDELYLKKHLHKIMREYRKDKEKTLKFSGYGKRFSFKANPIVHFPAKPPKEN